MVMSKTVPLGITSRFTRRGRVNVTFSREAKYSILILIRIVYEGLQAYGALLEAYLYCCTMK